MQNVAWPTTIVVSEKLISWKVKKEFSAIPVMIPGSASGSRITSDTASRPKKRKRCTANDAMVPSTIAIAVEISAARSDSHSASRMAWLWNVEENHLVERPSSGQLCTFDSLNAYRQMSAIGNSRKTTISAVQSASAALTWPPARRV